MNISAIEVHKIAEDTR